MIEITREVIDTEALVRSAEHPQCGAILVFSGTVRNHHQGRQVRKLAYDAYEPMAREELARITRETHQRWPEIKKIQAVHRFGEMAIGESSILITVSAPHRVEGFEALRHMIDTIKARVPIWKKEFYVDGETAWIHPEDGCCHH